MNNYFNYLSTCKEDENWGLCTLNAGLGSIGRTPTYPSIKHPVNYFFSWAKGRVLNEYQLIYITQGNGHFESSGAGRCRVLSGDVILLFPEEWHRYKPDDESGWNEYWVGFRGRVIDDLIRNHFFSRENPIRHIGFREDIVDLFSRIAETTKDVHLGSQPLISGMVMHLLGGIYAASQDLKERKPDAELMVNKAKVIFREKAHTALSAQQVADSLGVSYSSFRKAFKSCTGISPGQFLIKIRLEKAKELLKQRNVLVKTVAYEAGFESSFYFSRLFKEKTGLSPAQFRAHFSIRTRDAF